MGLYQQSGYKRLSVGITILAFFITLITFWVTDDTGSRVVLFIYMPAVSAVVAGVAFCAARLIYWIIDGFKSHK
jgi:hypothetical protein